MRYRTQAVAYPYFVVALLLYGLQTAFGLLSAVKYLGPDPLIDLLPFDVSKAIHTNLLIVWILTGFMGAAYWLVPEESRTELHSPKMAYWALDTVDGGRRDSRGRVPLRLDRREQAPRTASSREASDRGRHVDVPLQPRHDDLEGKAPDDNGGHPDGRARAHGHSVSALAVRVRNYTIAIFYRWWTVHLWVEGVWEMIQGALLAYLLIRLSGIDREVMEKWLYVIVGLTFISGLLGTAHHYYFIGVPQDRLPIGGLFSALEPLVFVAMSAYVYQAIRRSGLAHPNTLRAALDARERDLLGAWRGPARPRAHLALGQPMDPRDAHHADARALGVFRRVRDDRARRDHLRNAVAHGAPRIPA